MSNYRAYHESKLYALLQTRKIAAIARNGAEYNRFLSKQVMSDLRGDLPRYILDRARYLDDCTERSHASTARREGALSQSIGELQEELFEFPEDLEDWLDSHQ